MSLRKSVKEVPHLAVKFLVQEYGVLVILKIITKCLKHDETSNTTLHRGLLKLVETHDSH